MSETRLGIQISATDSVSGDIARLRAEVLQFQTQVAALRRELLSISAMGVPEALKGTLSAGTISRLSEYIAKLDAAKAKISELSSATVRARQDAEFDLERRLQIAHEVEAANTGSLSRQLEARRAFLAQSRADYETFIAQRVAQMRAEAGGAIGARDPRTGRFESFETAARREAPSLAQFTAAAAAGAGVERVEQAMSRGASGARAFAGGMREATTATTGLERASTHLIPLFDELAAGRRRQAIATLGATLRSAGLGAAGLAAGFGAIAAIGATTALQNMAVHYGELAEKAEVGAAAAGTSAEEFQRFSGVMDIITGKANAGTQAIGILAEKFGQAAAAEGLQRAQLLSLGLSLDEIKNGAQHPLEALERIRQLFQQGLISPSLLREGLGRGFAEFLPYITRTDEELGKIREAVERTASVMDSQQRQAMERAKDSAGEFNKSLEGLGEALVRLASSSGASQFSINFVQNMTNAINSLDDLIKKIGEFNQTHPDPTWLQNVVGAISTAKDIITHPGGMLPPPPTVPSVATATLPPPNQVSTAGLSGEALARAQQFQAWAASGGQTPLADDISMWVRPGQIPLRPGPTPSAASMLPPQFPALATTNPDVFFKSGMSELHQRLKEIQEATQLEQAELKNQQDHLGEDRDKRAQIQTQIEQNARASAEKQLALAKEYSAKATQLGLGEKLGPEMSLLGNQAQVQALGAAGRTAVAQLEADQQRLRTFQEQQNAAIARLPEAERPAARVQALQAELDLANAKKLTNEATRIGVELEQARAAVLRQTATMSAERAQQTRQHALLEERAVDLSARGALIQRPGDYAAVGQARIDAATRARDVIVASYETELATAIKVSGEESVQADRVRDRIISATLEWQDKVLSIQNQVAEEAKRAAEKMAKPFTDAFDTIGAGIENVGADMLKLTPDKRDSPFQKSLIGTLNQLTSGLVRDFGEMASQSLTSLLPGAKPGEGLGAYLGGKVAGLFGLTPPQDPQQLLKTSLDQNKRSLDQVKQSLDQLIAKIGGSGTPTVSPMPSSVPSTTMENIPVGATSATAPAASNLAGTMQQLQNGVTQVLAPMAELGGGMMLLQQKHNTMAQVIGGVTIALGVFQFATLLATAAEKAQAVSGFIKTLFMEGGGIVPSAAGGMVVGGATGGIPAILHAREMVLPAHISEGFQRLFSGGGLSLTYNAQINSRPFATRGDVEEMLAAHGGSFESHVANWARNRGLRL